MFHAPETPDPGDTPETRHQKQLRWLGNRNHVQQMNAINAGLGGDPIRPGEMKYVFFLLAKIISGIFMAGVIVLVLLHTLFGNAHGKQLEHHRIADWIGQQISADYQLSPASTYMSQAQLASLMPASELAVASTMENPAIKDHNGAGFNRINASAYACRISPSCMASLDQQSPMATQWAISRSKAFLLQYLFYNKKNTTALRDICLSSLKGGRTLADLARAEKNCASLQKMAAKKYHDEAQPILDLLADSTWISVLAPLQ